MTLKSILRQIIGKPESDEYIEVVYAELENGKFAPNSKAVILHLSEEEMELRTNLISEKYCPTKKYFCEVIFIQDMFEGINQKSSENEIQKRIKIIIDYVENDA